MDQKPFVSYARSLPRRHRVMTSSGVDPCSRSRSGLYNKAATARACGPLR